MVKVVIPTPERKPKRVDMHEGEGYQRRTRALNRKVETPRVSCSKCVCVGCPDKRPDTSCQECSGVGGNYGRCTTIFCSKTGRRSF